tara:strand:- start:184 stop:1572 length:1389 start_codon:yes stop_codon:yes gene_type:complete
MSKMKRLLQEQRKTDSALDAFLAEEGESVRDEYNKATDKRINQELRDEGIEFPMAVRDEMADMSPAMIEVAEKIALERGEPLTVAEAEFVKEHEESHAKARAVLDAVTDIETVSLDTLADRGYLVSVHMTEYKSMVRDDKVSKEVAANKKANEKVVNVKKDLLADCGALKNLNNLCASIRKRHGELTLPWGKEGWSLVPNLDYMFKYWEWQREAEADFLKGKDALNKNYDWALQRAHVQLGDLYDPSEYLTKEEVLRKFTVTFEGMNVPQGDLRVVDNNERFDEAKTDMVDAAKANAELSHKKKLARVGMQAWGTLIDPVCNLLYRLREKDHDGTSKGFKQVKRKDGSVVDGDPIKPQYKGTLISNVLAQVDMLDAWFTTAKGIDTDNDDASDRIVKLARNIRNVEVETLKVDSLLRERTREYALLILQAIPKTARDTKREQTLTQKQVGAAKERVEILDSI